MLAGMAVQGYFAAHKAPDIERYQQRIREVAARLPMRSGSWVGEDVAVPTQSLDVLKPNVIIGRHYLNIENGLAAGVLLVHCGDAHYMVGHFPLRCYPAQGWQVRESFPRDWTVGSLVLTGMEYHFYRSSKMDFSGEQSIIVANCLLRPGGRVLRDMDEMTRTIIGAGGSSSGAGQVQVYFDATVPQAQRDKAIVELMNGYRPLIEAILADPAAGKGQAQLIGAARQ